jgi:hypothetical protein
MLIQIQMEMINLQLSLPLKNALSEHGLNSDDSESVVIQIWRTIFPWQREVSLAWTNGVEKAAMPFLDVEKLAGISLKSNSIDIKSDVNLRITMIAFSIAGQLLLTVGKRNG